jgi:F-type H+-transporting ATPase subunit b
MISFNATLFIVFLSFLVFMFLMKIVFFDPVMRLKLEREQQLKQDEEKAQECQNSIENLNKDYHAGLEDARKRSQEIIQSVRAEAKAEAQQALQKAREEAHAKLESDLESLKVWREETRHGLQTKKQEIAAMIAKQLFGSTGNLIQDKLLAVGQTSD